MLFGGMIFDSDIGPIVVYSSVSADWHGPEKVNQSCTCAIWINEPQNWIFFYLEVLSNIPLDVEASESPAFDVVLKADTKRLQLLEEVSSDL